MPGRDAAIALGGTGYRGSIIVRAKGDTIDLINSVMMESYLGGVVGSEMPLSWSEAALGAQVIAARTYALNEVAGSRRDGFDVHDTDASQVYHGMKNENEKARRVVEATRGQYLVFEGKVLKAFFSSTCGGHTASAASVFGGSEIRPLAGSECGACSASKWHRWTVDFPVATIATKLAQAGYPVKGDIRQIEVVNPGPGGHGTEVKVVSTEESKRVPAGKFRGALGYSELRSTAFTATREDDSFRFEGRGWGHGVGLCQYGAEGLAKRGKTTREIVEPYYPGAELQQYR